MIYRVTTCLLFVKTEAERKPQDINEVGHFCHIDEALEAARTALVADGVSVIITAATGQMP